MNVKAFMFAVLGLVVSAGLTMAWVGHDMHEISKQERAQLEHDCTTAAHTAGTPSANPADVGTGLESTAPSSATLPDANAPAVTDKFVARCTQIGITVRPAETTPAAAPQPDATGLNQTQGAPQVQSNAGISSTQTMSNSGAPTTTATTPSNTNGPAVSSEVEEAQAVNRANMSVDEIRKAAESQTGTAPAAQTQGDPLGTGTSAPAGNGQLTAAPTS
jgi:hypothetical protein